MPVRPVVVNYYSGEKSKTGTRRYYCPRCQKTVSSYQKKTGKKKSLIFWLEKYILGGVTYEVLSSWSKLSIQALCTRFHTLLLQNPPSLKISELQTEEAYLLVDGLWFGKKHCLMLYRHSQRKVILYISFLAKEYGSLIAKDLQLLQTRFHFTGVVSDGGTGIRNAVFRVFGSIPHQICLAHLHRDVINAIGRYPKDYRVQKLKKLADHVFLIESKEALGWWKDKLQGWIIKNRDFLEETKHVDTGGWWYIHRGARKAVRILVSLPDSSFKFLDRPLMPKTTNQLEGSISVLARKYGLHKGLKEERILPFLKWFIFFYNRKILSQRKS